MEVKETAFSRKVIRLGESTLVISLPAKWAKQHQVGPGTSLTVSIDRSGAIKVLPPLTSRGGRGVSTAVDINIDEYKDERMIERMLIACYITGKTSVRIYTNKGMLTPDKFKVIRSSLEKLEGSLIVDHGRDYVVVEYLVEASEVSFNNMLRRMFMLARYLLETVALQYELGYISIDEIVREEEDLDRTYKLSVRQLLSAQTSPAYQSRIGIDSPLHIVGNRTIIKMLEDIGDKVFLVLKTYGKRRLSHTPKEIREKVAKLLRRSSKLLQRAHETFKNRDAAEASKILDECYGLKVEILRAKREIIRRIRDHEEVSIAVDLIDSILDVLETIKHIGEISINRVVEDW